MALRPLSQNTLNIENKKRSNLLAWRGQFSPQLVESLLTAYAPIGAFVLDPFMGSGTVLYEAGRLGLQVFGAEINPAAVKLSQVYKQINRTKTRRETVLNKLERLLEDRFPLPKNEYLFGEAEFPQEEEEIIRRFIKLHSTIEAGDSRELLETLIVLIDFYKPDLSIIRIWSIWKKLCKMVIYLPYSKNPIRAELCDARNLPLPDNYVDFVITSPPYINVFNYHQQYRASVEAIGWDVLELAKSEIGSNRKFRQNRFLTIAQYCIDMADVLNELRRVGKPYTQLIFVVGKESMVKKTRFFNGEILSEIATRCLGYELELKQKRFFKNKFGQIIYEDILHLRNDNKKQRILGENPASIARHVLEEARSRTPSESEEDLELALQELDTVPPSPLYKNERIGKKYGY